MVFVIFFVGNSDGLEVAEYGVGVRGDIGYGCNGSDIEKFNSCIEAEDRNGLPSVNACLYLYPA